MNTLNDMLGGFAVNEKDIDGNYDEFIAFNYCLAYDYYLAFKNENFDIIGNISNDTLNQICYWLNYDGAIGSDIKTDIDGLKIGKMVTNYGRTLVQAIVDKKIRYLAFLFMVNGSNNKELLNLLDKEEKNILKLKRQLI